MPSPSIRTARLNRILAAIPREVCERIVPDLRMKTLAVKDVLQMRGVPLEHVVFPVAGVASMVSTGDSGGSVEVATIGCEGMVGLPLLLGGESASGEVFVQVPGEGLFMAAAHFERHIRSERTLMRTLLLYTQALLTQVAQCSACNNYHEATARCARWLLQTHDRVKGDEFSLTHEFLGLMLGVRRATVTMTAQVLQKRGLIRYHRGIVTVLNRGGLERASCECYRLINHEFVRLLGAAPRRATHAGRR
jgi:CRP-like cAMP-binding protein